MARFCTLFSGSTGNCTYVGTSKKGILIDAGASGSSILSALAERGITEESIAAICVTHEHIDHIKGLSPLLKKLRIPLIASPDTLKALEEKGKIPKDTTVIETTQDVLDMCDIGIKRFAISHDCTGASGYTFFLPQDTKIAVCTDTGIVTDEIRQNIKGSDLCLLESNHDLKMLKNGPYPPELKLRIMSDFGHLSNNACAAELPELLKCGTKRFVLGHLSQHNNTPNMAKASAKNAFTTIEAKENEDYILTVASVNGDKMMML